MKRKIFSLVLTMALVFALIPASVASAATNGKSTDKTAALTAPELQKPVTGNKQATLKWKNGDKSYTGYQIVYSKYPDFKKGKGTIYKNIKGGDQSSAKLKSLKTGYTYYTKVRAFKETKGEKRYSKWSNKKQFTVPLKRAYAKKVKLNQKVVALKDGSGLEYFKFTAPKTDEYVFSIRNMEEYGCDVELYTSKSKYIDGFYEDGTIAKSLKKGQTIYVKFSVYKDDYYEYEDENGEEQEIELFLELWSYPTLKITNPDPIVIYSNDYEWHDVRMKLDAKKGVLDVKPKSVVDAAYGAVYYGREMKPVSGKIKKVNLHEGIKEIGNHAFFGFKNLKEINLPETLRGIEYEALANTPKLKKLAIPPSVVYLSYSEISKKVKIYGEPDSGAQAYAKKNGNKFVSVLDSPVLKLKASSKDRKPYLEWKKVKGASKYEVWRKIGDRGTYHKMLTTSKTTVHNKSIKKSNTYYYKVKALHGSDPYKNSFFSKEKSITYKKR